MNGADSNERKWSEYAQGTPDQRRVFVFLESINYTVNAGDAYRHLAALLEEVRADERDACLEIVRNLGEQYGEQYGPDKPRCPSIAVQRIESAIENRRSAQAKT